MDNLLDLSDAAKLLGTTPRALRSWMAKREIDYVKPGKYVFFRQSAIDRYLEEKTVRALPKKGAGSVALETRKKGAA